METKITGYEPEAYQNFYRLGCDWKLYQSGGETWLHHYLPLSVAGLYVASSGTVRMIRKSMLDCQEVLQAVLGDKKSGYSGPSAAEVAQDDDRADYAAQVADLLQF